MIHESSHAGGPGRGPFVGQQSWHDLLFAHWPVPAAPLERLLPQGVALDHWGGTAWIGVVPFALRDLRGRFLPGVPTATDFLELNVRTYVTVGGRPGVWFLSMDASSRLAAAAARTLLGLPYLDAHMTCAKEGDWVSYRSVREEGGATFDARYRPTGFAVAAEPGSIEEFLVERYRLFTTVAGKLLRLEIDHAPWALRPAEAEIRTNTLVSALGLSLPPHGPRLDFVDRQDVRTGLPIPADG